MDWLRWHHGCVTDPKFQLVARKTGTSTATVIAVWAVLLETASQCDDRGDIGSIDCEAVNCLLGLDDGVTERVIQALRERGLVAGTRLAKWETRQPTREREDSTAADRKRRQRERETANQSLSDESAEMSRHVTPCHAMSHQVTPRLDKRRVDKKDQELELLRNSCVASDTLPSETADEPKAKTPKKQTYERFAEFWAEYPRGDGKLNALKKWKSKNLDARADEIIADVKARRERHRQWLDGFIPHAATYLHGERWTDPITDAPKPATKPAPPPLPTLGFN